MTETLRRLSWLPIVLLLACARPPVASEATPEKPQAKPDRTPAHVMSYSASSEEWLEREGREEEAKPEIVLQAMDLKPGQTVADIGAGTGYFSRRIAPVVGPTGKVYANDIQPRMLEALQERAAKEGITNIVPILGTETDPKLPEKVDRILLVDVYHELQQPEEMLARIRDSVKPGGMVIVIEFRKEGESASHIHPDHKMSAEEVLAEWLPAGFQLIEQIETLPTQHMFLFTTRRGAQPVP
jgi:predicted methyltransferase